jgi:hypothetical protein
MRRTPRDGFISGHSSSDDPPPMPGRPAALHGRQPGKDYLFDERPSLSNPGLPSPRQERCLFSMLRSAHPARSARPVSTRFSVSGGNHRPENGGGSGARAAC